MGLHLLDYFGIMAILFCVSRLKPAYRRVGALAWCGLFLIFFGMMGHRTLQLCLIPLHPVSVSPSDLKLQLEQAGDSPIYVDTFALNEVFDYRLPPSALDYQFGLKTEWGGAYPAIEDFPKGSLVVVSKQNLVTLGRLPQNNHEVGLTRIPLVGYLFPPLAGNPYDCAIVPGGSR
jgi:hypothetical protein